MSVLIDRVEFMKAFVQELKGQGYSDWYVGANSAIMIRVLDLALQDDEEEDQDSEVNRTEERG